MIALPIILLFLGGAACNLALLARMRLLRIDFLDGILIGQVYYVVIPMAVFLIAGETAMPPLSLVYRPYEDLSTTGLLIAGLYLFPLLRVLAPPTRTARCDSDPQMLSVVLALFIVSGLLSFLASGLAQGGHWQGNVDAAMRNPAFVVLKYVANVSRNAVFAVLLHRVASGWMSAARAICLGSGCALFDLATTFNRITAVYLLLMVLLLLKDRPLRMVATGAGSLAGLSLVSAYWPAFRGLATAQGYSVASFASAWDSARRAGAGSASSGALDAAMNGVFESSNIVVLNWIVEHFGSFDRPFLVSAMYARPLTLLLPASLWPQRPENFGLTLGDAIAGNPSLALNSTLFGEAFANFGWFWPVGLGAFVLFWHFAFRLLAPHSRVVQTMGAFAAIAMWRFDASFVGCAFLLTAALTFALACARIARLSSTRGSYA